MNEQELARKPIDDKREPGRVEAEQEQEEKSLVDKAMDKAREKGLVDKQTADEVREKGVVDAIKDRLTGR